jgi:dipeptide/tripeptide permease
MAQLVIGIVFLFILGIVFVASFMAQSQINTELQLDTEMNADSKVILQNQTNAMPDVFDSGLILIAVILFVIVLALAYNAPSNPVALIAVILVISALGFASMFISNAWDDFSSDAEFGLYTVSFPFTSFLLDNFLIYVLALGFSSLMMYLYSTGGLG